jgi:nitrogen fixation protein NifU and related proteins
MTNEIYRARILDHFRHPRHRGGLETMQAVGRAAIPMCGDEIEVGVREVGDKALAVRFRGRGCAVCMASASMMAEAVTGLTCGQANELARAFAGWMLDGAEAEALRAAAPELVETFAAVREAGSRARCAALPWGALGEALSLRAEASQLTASVGTAEPVVSASSAPG